MRARILSFSEIRSTDAPFAGGKGVHLATLSRTAEFQVPPGVVVTTHAFREMVAESPRVARLLDPTQPLDPQNLDQCLALGGQLRQHILHTPLPLPLRADLTRALHAQGLLLRPCAVRSSATSEDLLTASSAGQHDSFLEVLGIEPLLEAIRACWASLYSERAVRYAHRNGLEFHTRSMAVVVQAMLHPQVSGVLFTADPLSGNRTITR